VRVKKTAANRDALPSGFRFLFLCSLRLWFEIRFPAEISQAVKRTSGGLAPRMEASRLGVSSIPQLRRYLLHGCATDGVREASRARGTRRCWARVGARTAQPTENHGECVLQ
jgi:hypothetical protein